MRVTVCAHVEKRPMNPAAKMPVHRIHFLRSDGKKICRCKYSKDAAYDGLFELYREGESGQIYVDQPESMLLSLAVSPCDKSWVELNNELKKLMNWNGK